MQRIRLALMPGVAQQLPSTMLLPGTIVKGGRRLLYVALLDHIMTCYEIRGQMWDAMQILH